MPASRIDVAGKLTQLDRSAQPDEVVTEADVQEPARVARYLQRLLRDVAKMLRFANPRRIDFEDVVVDATVSTAFRFPHHFGGRARWWVVGWTGAAAAPILLEDRNASDDTTLVLFSGVAGTATIRVEEAL